MKYVIKLHVEKRCGVILCLAVILGVWQRDYQKNRTQFRFVNSVA